MNTLRTSALFVLLVLGACSQQACSQQGPAPYAERYAAALERYPGVAPASDESVDAFVQFFSGHAPGESPTAGALYARELYFSDTLLTSELHEEVIAHLERMRTGADELAVTVLDHQVDGADVYLIWRMRAQFTPTWRTVESDSIGMTHLRFDADGRIVLQQDFWDSAEGFYRHLPVVGSLIDSVARRFSGDDS